VIADGVLGAKTKFINNAKEDLDNEDFSWFSSGLQLINTKLVVPVKGKQAVWFAALQEALPPDMPCAAVYWAGYPDRQRIVRGTVADMGEKLAADKEKFMGLLFIGRFLGGKPYEAAMKRGQKELE
jgi:siroheme synthase